MAENCKKVEFNATSSLLVAVIGSLMLPLK